jgi:hypothetical protein
MITEILAMLSHIDSAEVLKRAKEALKKNRNQLYVLPEIESKEEPMGIRAEDVNLSHLGTLRVGYAPKNILTEAIQATQENIGKLALEFESELRYNEAGFPFFLIDAERGTEDKPKPNCATRSTSSTRSSSRRRSSSSPSSRKNCAVLPRAPAETSSTRPSRVAG